MLNGSGHRDTRTAETAADLAKHIMACGTDQAIALGTLKTGLPESSPITAPEKLKDNPGAITRSREFIDYRPGAPAWALIDFDTKGMPANVAASIESAGGMWNALLTVAPGLNGQRAYHAPAQVLACFARTPKSSSVAAGVLTTTFS